MIKKARFIKLISQGDFRELFVSELGWNRFRGQAELPVISFDDREYHVRTIAERNGFQVLTCEVDEIPTQGVARKIDTRLRRQAQDYICIYRLRGTGHHLWVVPVRANEKRDLVLIEYETAEKAELLYSKIDGFSFDFDEVTNIVDLRTKVHGAFAVNSEKITKDFYAGFKKEHKAFAEFITGIDDHIDVRDNRNKQWYTSVMLNRLMFCYFIQKKGFLNLDTDYLRTRLESVRREIGENRFYKSFYRGFLSSLFHDGLNTPKHDREFERRYGKIPYLNGGMFDEHPLEREYPGIDIDDEAFIRLFDFFDKWRWHLDTRITASGRDINPDVLGYIFEQYINDRAQMGAYYTKEDITEYIGRNCILPYLFDQVRTATNDSRKEFEADGYVWRTLRESGNRYIFDAVKKGYNDFDRIPASIARGIITDDMRKEYSETPVGELPDGHIPLAELRAEWNTRTPDQWGLPNEIWRESIERIQRCGDILGKISRGEITSINDFITYNLDIRSFAVDLIARGNSRFVGWFYHALQKVTILDPTCGSGAFLFAAMNILEPLYEICIDRMQEFNSENPSKFKDELAEITDKYRSNIQYFIFKSIILRNLYGVDIMVEATEIAKLRLFLKMVAVVDVDRRADNLGLDPLPDIDFNIRCGNTLVGYANKTQLDNDLNNGHGSLAIGEANKMLKDCIEEEMKKVASTYKLFKEVQLKQDEDMSAFKTAKHNLRERLIELNDKLNRRLYLGTHGMEVEDGVDYAETADYKQWLKSHQPFHWLAEFYQIIEGNGGFDVIIGNPPYVSIKKITYQIDDCIVKAPDIYGMVLSRIQSLTTLKGTQGMIIMHNLAFNHDFDNVRKCIQIRWNSIWWSFYSRIPSGLFDGSVRVRNCIYIANNTNVDGAHYATRMHRWYATERDNLFKIIRYGIVPSKGIIPMSPIYNNIKDLFSLNKNIETAFVKTGTPLYFKAVGYNWITISPILAKSYDEFGNDISLDVVKELRVRKDQLPIISLLVAGKVGFLSWMTFGDDFNVTKKGFSSLCLPDVNESDSTIINELFQQFKSGLPLVKKSKLNCGKTLGSFDISKLWNITDAFNMVYFKYFPSITESHIDAINCEIIKLAPALYKE